ncbi:hypothetical protein F5X99DRAFT_427381 [Biscogniauxia marginata]|nr:hypothetical protein F5X99DRAFT_427381 [Biscogniauxia marginata]
MASPRPFPPEIIQRIVYYLTHGWIGLNGPDENLPLLGIFRSWGRIGGAACYSTVDKAWQDAVERETFAELRLDLDWLAEAEAILNGKQNNRTLQNTFEAFLSTLNHWTPGPPVKLYLDAFALTDKGYGDQSNAPSTRVHGATYHSPLELEDPERLLRRGPVNVVTEADMERNRLIGRHFSAAAVCTLVARLPVAKKVSINWRDTSGHSKMRTAFAQALTNVTHALDNFHIAGTYSQLNRQQPAHQYKPSEAKPDELSQSLGVLSQRLRNLDLYEVVVSDELFLQHDLASEMASPAHWARLENFSLYYPPVTPSGQWLFYPDPGVPDGQRATTVADPAIQCRYLTAARAALEMPLLKNMTLVTQLERDGDWHKFWYHRDAKGNVAKALWTSSSGFVPEGEVLAAWREVPRKHLGETELEVEILEDEYAV